MKKLYAAFFITFVCLYMAGRICLVSTYSFTSEKVKDIFKSELPKVVLNEISNALRVEKSNPSVIIKKTFVECSVLNHNTITHLFGDAIKHITFLLSINLLSAYDGHFIDPPPRIS
ncbi:MAG: hypothetical protein ABIT08_04400 [Bacteroidia bacterium]